MQNLTDGSGDAVGQGARVGGDELGGQEPAMSETKRVTGCNTRRTRARQAPCLCVHDTLPSEDQQAWVHAQRTALRQCFFQCAGGPDQKQGHFRGVSTPTG